MVRLARIATGLLHHSPAAFQRRQDKYRVLVTTGWRPIAIDLIAELESRRQGRSGFAAPDGRAMSVPNELQDDAAVGRSDR
jgi:hypothetical protein